MDALIHRITAWDGLPLLAREWHDGNRLTPLLCLPGLVRTGEDFGVLPDAVRRGRRVVTLDYAGRGGSGRMANVQRYAPEACLRDVLDVCAALHLHGAILIGTSFGGLLGMGLATARPGLLAGVVLNDIGPEIGAAGNAFVRDFVAHDPALPDLQACIDFLRPRLPPLSLRSEDEWRLMAELTYAPGPDGRFHPRWDTRIARLLNGHTPVLWDLFAAISHLPLLLIRGEVSDILLPETVARMRDLRPDMEVITLPGIGHAPTLGEAQLAGALRRWLGRLA